MTDRASSAQNRIEVRRRADQQIESLHRRRRPPRPTRRRSPLPGPRQGSRLTCEPGERRAASASPPATRTRPSMSSPRSRADRDLNRANPASASSSSPRRRRSRARKSLRSSVVLSADRPLRRRHRLVHLSGELVGPAEVNLELGPPLAGRGSRDGGLVPPRGRRPLAPDERHIDREDRRPRGRGIWLSRTASRLSRIGAARSYRPWPIEGLRHPPAIHGLELDRSRSRARQPPPAPPDRRSTRRADDSGRSDPPDRRLRARASSSSRRELRCTTGSSPLDGRPAIGIDTGQSRPLPRSRSPPGEADSMALCRGDRGPDRRLDRDPRRPPTRRAPPAPPHPDRAHPTANSRK